MIRGLHKRFAWVLVMGMVCLSLAWQVRADTTAPPQQLSLSPSDRTWLAAHPVIRLGIDAGYAPYSFLDKQGKLQGVVSEFLAYLGPALGVRFEIVADLDWPQLMAAVQERRIDAVATVAYLPEREAFLEFTAPYLTTPVVIMTRSDTPQLRSIEDLAKLSLVLVEGYSSSKQVMEQYPALRPHYVASPLEGLMAVASGATDSYVGALGVSTYLAAQHGLSNLKVNAAFDMAANGQRFGVRKDWPQLTRILDQALASMPDQRKNEIFQAWMPGYADAIQRLSQPTLLTRLFPWLIGVTGLAVLAYLVVLLWNRQLRRELALRKTELERDITDRKRAEAALQESETRLRLFIEHAPAALAMFDCEMRYLAVSTRWLSDYGLENDILGHSHYEVFPDIPEYWKAIHQRGLAGEVVRANEDPFEREDGTIQWLRWEVRPWRAANGTVGGIVIFSEDITESKQAEAGLRRQKDQLAHTGRLAQVGGWEIDVATMQYTMTDEVFRIFDLEPDPQTTEAPLIACLSKPDQSRLEQAQRAAIEHPQPYELEMELTTAKGAHKWIHLMGLSVLEDGQVVRLEGAVQDITERKQVEERAWRSWLILDSVFQALPDLFFLMDADGIFRDYRAQHRSALYIPPEAFLGKRMQDVLPPELSGRFKDKFDEVGKQGGLATFEYDLPIPDGSQHFEARLTQLPGSTQLLAVVRDITRQYKDQQALGDSEVRYRHVFEHNPAPMLVYERASLRLLAANEAFMRHYGYSHKEALALRITDLYPDEEKQSIVDLAAQLAGLAYVGEWHHLRKDGSLIAIEARSHDLQYEGLAARIVVMTDITERKQAEQALRDSEARYRSLLELAPFPVVLTRVRDGIVLYGNHRAETQYGISLEQGIGQPAERFYEDRSQRERFLESLQKTGKVDGLEVRMQTVDGRPFWALVSASIVEFDNEPAIFTAVNDISARKQAEAALQEQEAFFRLIAENMGDMVAVLDLDGRRLYNSPSYQVLFGDAEAMQGTDSFVEIHPDDRDKVRAVFMETVQSGHGRRVDFRFVLPDGQVRYMESQGGVIRGADGQVERVVVVSRDVTERRQMEDEIRQLNTELEERVRQRTAELAAANKELETFTYSVSHDLKAPLRGIDGYSRLLLEDYQDRLDQAGTQLVNNVRSGVAQMSLLIEDLLAYSRMERRSLLDKTLDLSQLVARVLGEMRAEIQKRGMVVDVSVPGLTARADPEGLTVVLRNLVDNALKFTRDSHPPTLSISGVANEKSITLIVRDNGIGFDMQFHHRIFEIFQRLQRAEDYPGTGVGLAIVYKAMQRMGGNIRAESAPGEGATFYLELPR